MSKQVIRIGTRGSQLALYQANKTKDTIKEAFPDKEVEVIVIHSKGDKILDVALSKIGDKGLFTKELEEAMLRDEIDIAVHSLKDLPTTLPEGLKLGAVLERAEVCDALVSLTGLKIADLTPDMKIATSSLRRKAQLLKINPDFNIVDIRGNVNTRLRKMEEGYCDAMIMAATGLQRLGLDKYITDIIDANTMLPAVSQGAIAIESRINDPEIDELLKAINHDMTFTVTNAERIFLRTLEGGCQIPIGCYSEVRGSEFSMKGFMSYIDGTQIITSQVQGDISEADQLASDLAKFFIDNGSLKLLDRIRNFNSN